MWVRDWMSRDVETARPDEDVAAVGARLRARRIRQLPVVDAGRLVGIVTDRDVRSATDVTTSVVTAMTPDPVTAAPGMPVEEAARLGREHKIGALPVLEDGRLVGIVSESDLLAALVELCAVLEPTTFLEVDAPAGPGGIARVRDELERRGAHVPWIAGTPSDAERQIVALRVRMPVGRLPEQVLEEAGLRVLSSITGRTVPGTAG